MERDLHQSLCLLLCMLSGAYWLPHRICADLDSNNPDLQKARLRACFPASPVPYVMRATHRWVEVRAIIKFLKQIPTMDLLHNHGLSHVARHLTREVQWLCHPTAATSYASAFLRNCIFDRMNRLALELQISWIPKNLMANFFAIETSKKVSKVEPFDDLKLLRRNNKIYSKDE